MHPTTHPMSSGVKGWTTSWTLRVNFQSEGQLYISIAVLGGYWFNARIGRSSNFKAVLARLEELKLFIRSEQGEASEREIEIPERHDF